MYFPPPLIIHFQKSLSIAATGIVAGAKREPSLAAKMLEHKGKNGETERYPLMRKKIHDIFRSTDGGAIPNSMVAEGWVPVMSPERGESPKGKKRTQSCCLGRPG